MDLSTAPSGAEHGRLRRSRNLRWVFFIALTAFLVAGALGVFGVRHREVSATGGGYELTVRYPTVTRPGLASVWSIEVRRVDGAVLDGPVTIATTDAYFDLYDENGLDPDPVAAQSDGENLVWEFEPADGATSLTIGFDARIEPGVQLTSMSATTSVLEESHPVVSVSYTTRVLP